MCDFLRISTDFWAAVSFLAVKYSRIICVICAICVRFSGVGCEKRTAVLAVLCVKVAGSRIELETSGL